MERDYKLEKEVYYETIWYIRQYPSMLKEYEGLIWKSSANDGQPRGTTIGDPTESAAERLATLSERISPIQKGLERVPKEYRKGLLENIINRVPYPYYADITTWRRWRRRFVFYVAMERSNR